jgi:hypothetical protein
MQQSRSRKPIKQRVIQWSYSYCHWLSLDGTNNRIPRPNIQRIMWVTCMGHAFYTTTEPPHQEAGPELNTLYSVSWCQNGHPAYISNTTLLYLGQYHIIISCRQNWLPTKTGQALGTFSILHNVRRDEATRSRYWKMLLTEPSRWTCQIVSATRFAIESTVSWGKHLSSGNRMEFVTMTSSKMPPESLSIAGGLQSNATSVSTKILSKH